MPDSGKNKVFISYAREDYETAKRLYDDLKSAGLIPWMDDEDLLPGQNWELTITKAIKSSRYFIALLSKESVAKIGFFQTELDKALAILKKFPQTDVFFIPARIDNCELPEGMAHIHCADLFPYERGLKKILRVLPAKVYVPVMLFGMIIAYRAHL